MKYIRITISLLFLLCCLQSFAQTDSAFLKKAVALSNKQLTEKPTEKVYLHLDKPFYNLTDTVWFKAYAVAGPDHQLSGISGVVYVELINARDSVVQRLHLKLNNGTAWGDFVLPANYQAGSYRLRAYTNWMRNQSADAMFNQRVQVNGRTIFGLSQPQVQATAQSSNPDVQFFAEGGSLITGLRSKIAVKAIGKNGLGCDVKGTIIDNDGAEVAEFETTHLGMGVFALMPQAGKIYKARITTDGVPSFTVNLPKAMDEGFTITVNNRLTDSIGVKITASAKTISLKQHTYYYLVGQTGGKVYYTTAFKLEDAGYSFQIEKKRFPSGVAQFTLFGADAEPLNERLAFIRSNDTLSLKLNIANQKFASRKEVLVALKTADQAGKPVTGTFSVSVINESRIPSNQNTESTILNNLLLTSDLKGYIEQPNYYFTNITDKTDADLDMLMLTQGYRGFEWLKTLNEKQAPLAFKAEGSLSLSGSIQTPGGKPLPNGKVTLLGNREDFFADTTADLNGDFTFDDVDVSDTSHLMVQARKQNNGKNVTIFIKKPDYPKVEKMNMPADDQAPPALDAREAYIRYMEQQQTDSIKNANTLKEVVIKGKKAITPNEYNRYGSLQQRSVNMAKLRSYKDDNLAGALHVNEPLAQINLTAAYKYNALGGGRASRFVIDGTYVEERQLSLIHVEEIESVDLIMAGKSSMPLIVVKTKRYAGTDTTVLKEVNIRATKTNKTAYKGYSAGKLGAAPDQIVMGNKLNGCTKLSDCLRSKIFGVTFDAKGNPISMRGNQKMAVILNGSVLDGSALDNINPNDIYSIEVLRGVSYAAIVGSDYPGGALAITTLNGGNYVTGSSSSLGVITYPFKGFYKARTFYSPKYTPANINSTTPDYRTTIFWEPNITTTPSGEATFRYFNSDTRGVYKITVEGIDSEGNLGRQIYRYKVE
ncbi:TonB-dependent receptor plug domain-containing protein [Mucilaginibacter celer]|uniref:TonB-dependent receptor plug domain-containing protein n=1 Tax=Mucilaginibacter celer TaxID=2305508 RepID=A0A494W142_9SPHI|nr:TonB-dependent receptor plug domain-containing protein [Mucilaginibacter celer]AYL97433.1 hypothetical protein HYN43_019930 [Mucilaginibacter celer]